MVRPRSSDKAPKARINRESIGALRFLLRYLRPYRWKFVVAMLALFISSVAALGFPGLTGMLIDATNNKGTGLLGTLDGLTLVLIGILLVQSIFSYVRTYFLTEVSERSLFDLRHDLYAHLLKLPMSFFHQNRVGDLSSRLSNDVSLLQATLTGTLSELIRQSVILVGGLVLVTYTSPRLTAMIMICVPALVALTVLFGRSIRRLSSKLQDFYAELATIVEETFQGISVVKSFTAEERESRRYRSKSESLIGMALKVGRARSAFIAFIIFILFGGIVVVIWFGGRMVQDRTLTVGELTSFVLYAVFVGGAMGSFADLYASFQRALGASERVRDLFTTTPEQIAEPSPIHTPGDVELRDIRFNYPSRPDIAVLNGVSLRVPAGSSLALVGPSGAGKSTVASLLMRFYEPTSGSILLDGREASSYELTTYRSMIGIVPQDIVLFGGTINENIAYGDERATPEQIREAARLANALEFIESFPDGFETIVGERGVQLSGGQRQRVAIARTILKDPSVLVLDEATSSLDNESERLVQEALDRVMKGRTTVIIAHRLSTIRNADMIAVINAGTVAEIGRYDALIASGGIFARMIEAQSRRSDQIVDDRIVL